MIGGNMKGKTKTIILFAAVVTALAVAANGAPIASLAEEPSPTATPTPTPTPDPHRVTSATVIMLENHGRGSVAAKMPKVTALGNRYAKDTNSFAITHPSKPNYLATWSGSTQGETSNRFALETGPSLFDLVAAAGGNVRTYAQSMGTDNCRQSNRGAYVWRHNPQVVFTATAAKRAVCEKNNRDFKYWAPELAKNNVGVLVHILPDDDHNWHDGSAAAADAWISARAAEFIASKRYRDGGVLVITADEDEKSGANDIPMIVIHQSLDGQHLSSNTRLDLKDLYRFLAEVSHRPVTAGHAGLFASTFGFTT